MRRRRHFVLVPAALVALLSGTALADTVKLKNGDTLTGKVTSVDGGKLTLKTDAAGELKIDLAQIETFATDEPITVELKDGSILMGKAVASKSGAITLDSALTGKQELVITNLDGINKPPRHWTGSLVGSGTWSRGNSETSSVGVDFNAENRGKMDRITTDAWYRGSRSTDQNTGDASTSERKYGARGQYDYFLDGEKFYLYGNAQAENDAIAALDARVIVGAGAGYQFLETDTTKISGEAGAAWFYENFSNGTPSSSDPSVRVAGHLTHDFAPAFSAFADAEMYKVFSGDPRDYLFHTKDGFREKFTESFFAQQWVEFTWDSTPATGKKRQDVTYYVGVGWTF